LLTAGGVLVGGVAAAGAFFGNTEHIASMWVGADVAHDGSAAIREVIDYDFGATFDKHGIFRDVPGLDPGAAIVVSSPDAPDGLAIFQTPPDSPSYPATRLRIGNPDDTVSGERRYLIAYPLDDIAPGGALAWDAVGAGWDVPIEQAEIQVAAPWELTDVRCVQGGTGSTTACEISQPEPGRLVVEASSLDAHQGITVYAAAGAPLEAAPSLTPPAVAPESDEGASVPLTALVGAGAALLGAGPASRAVRRRGRERVGIGGAADAAFGAGGAGERLVDADELASLATVEFAPPPEITPPQGGVVLREAVRQEHKVAWLIDEAIDGSIELVDQGPGKVSLRRGKGLGDPQAAPVLDQMFDGRQQLDLGTYDKPFAAGWSIVGSQLQHWADTSGLWDPKGDRRRVIVRVLGVLATVVGLLITGVGAALAANTSAWWLIAVAIGAVIAGVGLAGAVRGWELRVRTPEGAGLWLRVESFRKFLAQSEGYHAEQAAARGVLREYTAWAVAVGEVDRWTRAVNSAVNIPDRSALTYVYLAPILYSATSSSSTAPSSSGGGGGGGGVGGGGGGGGGGSW
jgi:hypothetical protein